MRKLTTRTPRSSAGRAAASQAAHSSWLKQACDFDENLGLAFEPRDQLDDLAGHVDARAENLRALRLGPQAVADRLAGEIDDSVDRRVRGDLIKARDQSDRRRQHLGLGGIADQRNDVMPCSAEARCEAAADEAGGT
jgi:hypothetical protein